MTGEGRANAGGPVLDGQTERALAALLAIPASVAAGVRERSPARRRPRRQYGPVLDLGAADTRDLDPDPDHDVDIAVDGSERSGGAAD